jgi:hypothetical protein
MPISPTPPEGYVRTHIKWDTPAPGWMEFDSILSRSVTHDGEITDHPVDSAGNVSDHYRTLPVPINIETIITNSPISLPKTHIGGSRLEQDISTLELRKPIVPGAPTSVGGFDISSRNQINISTVNYTPELERVNLIYQELLNIQKEARLLSVYIGKDWAAQGASDDGGYYKDVLLVSFSMTQDPGLSGAARLSMDFRQVELADVDFEAISVQQQAKPRKPRKPRSRRARDAGKRPVEASTNNSAAEDRALQCLPEQNFSGG